MHCHQILSTWRGCSVFQYILVLIRLFFSGYYHVFMSLPWTCALTAGPVCKKRQICWSDPTVLILREGGLWPLKISDSQKANAAFFHRVCVILLFVCDSLTQEVTDWNCWSPVWTEETFLFSSLWVKACLNNLLVSDICARSFFSPVASWMFILLLEYGRNSRQCYSAARPQSKQYQSYPSHFRAVTMPVLMTVTVIHTLV